MAAKEAAASRGKAVQMKRTNQALMLTPGCTGKGGAASELRFMGDTLKGSRNGLITSAKVTRADGHAEREAANSNSH